MGLTVSTWGQIELILNQLAQQDPKNAALYKSLQQGGSNTPPPTMPKQPATPAQMQEYYAKLNVWQEVQRAKQHKQEHHTEQHVEEKTEKKDPNDPNGASGDDSACDPVSLDVGFDPTLDAAHEPTGK